MTPLLPWNLEFALEAPGLQVESSYDPGTGRLQVTLTNPTDGPVSPQKVRLTAAPRAPAAGGWAWLQGRFGQTDALVRVFGAPPEEGYAGSFRKAGQNGMTYVSREVMVLNLPSKLTPALLVGSLRMDRFSLDIEATVDAEESVLTGLRLVADVEGAVIEPGESLELPPVFLLEGRDPQAMIEQYADDVTAEMGARVPSRPPAGWCSWYYFYDRVSEADVVANLEEMVRTRYPGEYVQIDDGFQSFTGDWLTPNEKFPSGMAALAARIREAGYRPGLWLAPFVMHEDSAVLREQPEIALRSVDGAVVLVNTWLGRCAVLDCTHPASEKWLTEITRTVVEEWGYEYLKLDALTFAGRPAREVRYFERGTTALANVRRGLEIIRKAAGEQTFILGCTCEFGAAIGLVDAMRVGADVKELWADGPEPSVKQAMRLTLQRNWMHGRWWANDPDCLIVRDTDTALNEAEVRFLATAIALSGGLVFAGDDLPKLSEARREMALSLFPPVGLAARPSEPGDGPVPRSWRTELGEGRWLVGILNWDDSPSWVVTGEHLRPGEIAFDLWNGRLLGRGDLLLRPHEGTLWQVAGPGPTPRTVGDTGHLNYAGLYQRPVSGRLQLRNDLDRRRTIAVEARGRVTECSLGPGEMRWFD